MSYSVVVDARARSIALLFFIMAVAQACSSGEDSPEPDGVSQAVEGDWIHPACTLSALGPPRRPAHAEGPGDSSERLDIRHRG